MDIQATRVHYGEESGVVRQGDTVFQEPYVLLCIQDSISAGETGNWSLLVDVVPYTVAVAQARGSSSEEAQAEAKAAYIQALAAVDVDGFESELFWETYQDVEWTKQNPYTVDTNAEEGWEGAYQ